MTTAPMPVHGRRAFWIAGLVFVASVIAVVAIVFLARHESTRSSASQGSGAAAVQPRHVVSFTGVELAGSNTVIVHVGAEQSVVVRGDDNLLGRVTTPVRAGSLVIGNRGSFETKIPMSVEVTVPSLDRLVLSGSGRVDAAGIKAQQVKVALSGSGTVRASGTATRLDVSLGGSGEIQLGRLVAREVHAVLLRSGQIVVNSTGSLDAAVRGSGSIVYRGSPKHISKSVTGSGAVTSG